MMEDDIRDSLEDLGYGSLKEEAEFLNAVEGGCKSIEYTQLVEWLSKELKVLCKIDDHVNAITNPDDSSSFLLEVSSFLKELYCPYQSLIEGNISQRLSTKQSKLQLLDFLCTELQSAKMIACNKPESPRGMQIEVDESETAAGLKAMLIALGFAKPPPNITSAQLFAKLETKVVEVMNKIPKHLLSKPLFCGMLSDKQWHLLNNLNEEFKKEYSLRREMLLKRIDVTVQSFSWSNKAKNKDKIASDFVPKRNQMLIQPKVKLADLLAAREDLAFMEKTSSSSVRKNTQCAINKIMIGRVPDRGGRPSEQQPPPPEMPSWQKRTDGGHQSGSGRGRGGREGGAGGERVQGNWSGDRRGGGGHRGKGDNYGDSRSNFAAAPVYVQQQQPYSVGPLQFLGNQQPPMMNYAANNYAYNEPTVGSDANQYNYANQNYSADARGNYGDSQRGKSRAHGRGGGGGRGQRGGGRNQRGGRGSGGGGGYHQNADAYYGNQVQQYQQQYQGNQQDYGGR